MATTPTLGSRVDALFKARAKRLVLEEKVEEMKKAEAAEKDAIIRALADAKLDGVKGKVATVAITKTTVPKVGDWSAFQAYILKTGAIELLEKRPSKSACAERWEHDEVLPGVEPMVLVNLSITKAGSK